MARLLVGIRELRVRGEILDCSVKPFVSIGYPYSALDDQVLRAQSRLHFPNAVIAALKRFTPESQNRAFCGPRRCATQKRLTRP